MKVPLKKILLTFFCVWVAIPAYVEGAGLIVANPQIDNNGVIWYEALSSYNGPGITTLRVLPPTDLIYGVPCRFIYVLPVDPGVDLQNIFGDGLEELRLLNIHNDYNTYLIAPSFHFEPWYADHDTDSERRIESFMVLDLVPWVRENLPAGGQAEHWLIGFSKSGFGAVTLLLRNPTVFDAAAAWDFPADQSDSNRWSMLENYGTDFNFQNNYRLTADWIADRKVPFRSSVRLWLSEDYVTYNGHPTFRDQVLAFAERLQDKGVQFMIAGGETRPHSWSSGWLPQAVAGLQTRLVGARGNFNRAHNDDSPIRTEDPLDRGITYFSGNKGASPNSNGGMPLWNTNVIEPDQKSQSKIAGETRAWTGASVRGSALPSRDVITSKSEEPPLYSGLYDKNQFNGEGQSGLRSYPTTIYHNDGQRVDLKGAQEPPLKRYTTTTRVVGTGSGVVTINPLETSFDEGKIVLFTAIPDASSTFTGWLGACSGTAPMCAITMNGAASVTAIFTQEALKSID